MDLLSGMDPLSGRAEGDDIERLCRDAKHFHAGGTGGHSYDRKADHALRPSGKESLHICNWNMAFECQAIDDCGMARTTVLWHTEVIVERRSVRVLKNANVSSQLCFDLLGPLLTARSARIPVDRDHHRRTCGSRDHCCENKHDLRGNFQW
jgi:hypothetical protein